MLDEIYKIDATLSSRNAADDNHYTLGRIGSHNIVLATLTSGSTGSVSAANVVSQILSTFPSIRRSGFGLVWWWELGVVLPAQKTISVLVMLL